jgi:hypothetical protein
MELAVLDNDVENLEDLRGKYDEQDMEIDERAVEELYDRQTTLKVGVLIDLIKVVAAYRYYTLKEFSLVLDPQVSVEDISSQLAEITSTVREVDENWDQDFHSRWFLTPPMRSRAR